MSAVTDPVTNQLSKFLPRDAATSYVTLILPTLPRQN